MLMDLFGRGYSASPDPKLYRYDSSLYATQILIAIQSSLLHWKSFTLIGYSLGGAIAADFASHFPSCIANLILLAPGGLIRSKHVTWKSRLLYSSSSILPNSFVERLVAKRLYTGPSTARTIEPESDNTASSGGGGGDGGKKKGGGGLRSQAVYLSSHTALLPSHPQSTVGAVVDWQIEHHAGFVPAFISSIRYAPIHDQHHRWRIIRDNMREGKSTFDRVVLVLGETDPIVVAEELVPDAKGVLGDDGVEAIVMKGTGHEVAIERPREIADIVVNQQERSFWNS
ncbi:alpha/beta-hydrolase [Aaosphaeria arxii CBS 175.79]|uniref:Alpha/beta-hydrolase n=1 Tax=Aaosphaeria arxii CBS 175.79 TaxID=1450172 RepID=A0A6A5Y9Y9_9PLEO|nr:alpha/beta-hydrolase [Aaosphaeria arxii CBS 175.79]KAF2022066.1 alpha/beta-hydrolase [Aaosphaeria arxii CBS 175.79]